LITHLEKNGNFYTQNGQSSLVGGLCGLWFRAEASFINFKKIHPTLGKKRSDNRVSHLTDAMVLHQLHTRCTAVRSANWVIVASRARAAFLNSLGSRSFRILYTSPCQTRWTFEVL